MQTAAVLVLEAIFEADLQPEQHAYRAGHSAHDAVRGVHEMASRGHDEVVEADLSGYFGLTPRAVLEKFATIQMVDVHLPTTDGRQLVLPRYTQPDSDHQLLFQQLKLNLPAQPPPRICV